MAWCVFGQDFYIQCKKITIFLRHLIIFNCFSAACDLGNGKLTKMSKQVQKAKIIRFALLTLTLAEKVNNI